MFFNLKKIIFNFTYNLSLFLILIIGIKNSSSSLKIKLFINETIKLPVSFIVGLSFISGSLTGSLLRINYGDKKD